MFSLLVGYAVIPVQERGNVFECFSNYVSFNHCWKVVLLWVLKDGEDVINCLLDCLVVVKRWDWSGVRYQLNCICVYLLHGVWVVALHTSVVFQARSNVPAFSSMEVPGSPNWGFVVDDHLSPRWGHGSFIEVKVAKYIGVRR